MNAPLRILIVDGDRVAREHLLELTRRDGHHVEAVHDLDAALHRIERAFFDLALCDLALSDARRVIEQMHAGGRESLVVLMNAFAPVEVVSEALEQGAHDFLLKPVEAQAVTALAHRVRAHLTLQRSHDARAEALRARDTLIGLVAGGPSMVSLLREARCVAKSDAPVTIRGEAGAGAEALARVVHGLSPRNAGPCVQVDCRADTARLREELCGRGDGGGARWNAADGGTLVLEHVHALPADLHGAVVETWRAHAPRVRVIATTTDLGPAPRARVRGRHELLPALCAYELRVPALRERVEDIPMLVDHLLADPCRAASNRLQVAPDAMAALMAAPWSGNLPELQRVVCAAMACVGDGATMRLEHLPETFQRAGERPRALAEQMDAYERAVLRQALEYVEGQVGHAARALGVPERTLRRKMRHFGITKEPFRQLARLRRARPQPTWPASGAT